MIRDTTAQDRRLHKTSGVRRKMTLFGLGLAGLAALSAYALPNISALYSSDLQLDAQLLRFATVTEGDFQRDIMTQGRIIAAVSPTFYANADGIVSLHVKAGDSVKQNQILASIDSPGLASQLAQESATLDSLHLAIGRQKIDGKTQQLGLKQRAEIAKVDLKAAQREMKRAELSKQADLISEVEYEQINVALSKAQLTFEHARESEQLEKERLAFELQSRQKDVLRQQFVVNELKRRINDLDIRAPFDGLIGNVNIQEKQAVTRNTPLLTAVDMTAFEIEVQIPEIYADELGPGMRSDISLDGDVISGELTAISPEVVSGQVSGRIRFNQTPSGLRQNQRISARILIESRVGVLKVKRGPFMESSGGKVAYLVDNNTAKRTKIELGAFSIGEVEVLSGLKRGDKIIISSNEQYRKSNTVFITN